jgi:hypothetical protein
MTSCPARLEHSQQNIGRVGGGAECDDDARAAIWGHAVDQVPDEGACAYNDPRMMAHGFRWCTLMPCFRQRRLFLTALWALLLGGILIAPDFVPLSDRGDFLIRNTVRLALVYWAVAVALMIHSLSATARLAWTLGCAAYLIHVALAFEYAHHWSHREAFRHVEVVSGYGEGIFVSYLFTLVWSADVLWWWMDAKGYRQRPRWVGWAVHGFMVFVIVNATVIFESGVTRWVGVGVLTSLGLDALLKSSRTIHSLSPRFWGRGPG